MRVHSPVGRLRFRGLHHKGVIALNRGGGAAGCTGRPFFLGVGFLNRRTFFCAVGAAALCVPAVAYGFEPWTPAEISMSDLIKRWSVRTASVVPATSSAVVSNAVASELAWAGRAAPFLRVFGRWLGPLGVGLSLIQVLQMVSADNTLASITKKIGEFQPVSTYDEIIDKLGIGGTGYVEVSAGVFRSFWVTAEPSGFNIGKYAARGWNFVHQRNSPEPEPGKKAVVWEHASGSPAAAPAPSEPIADVVAKLKAMSSTVTIAAESVKTLGQAVLETAWDNLPENLKASFPDPRSHPVQTDDVDPDKWKLPVLTGDTPATRDTQLSDEAAVQPGSGSTDTFGDPPVKLPLPSLGDLPWPSWHIADAPPVAESCTDPTMTLPFSAFAWPGGSSLSDYSVVATGYCAAGRSLAVFVRPFVLAVVTLGCVISALTNKE